MQRNLAVVAVLCGSPRGASIKTLSLLSVQRLQASHCGVGDVQTSQLLRLSYCVIKERREKFPSG